ncbi:Ead domain protein [Klebsiella pneumoniae]|uniref:hypothetical protein n=1 Tax=Klebsiella pneumoniae TaxID=573 RepID=UPI000E2A477F|nr:hypothetical protein [Klebsiella pneumoniae]SYD86864.1 Ead domain protein [Klebsiella pneumoniae]
MTDITELAQSEINDALAQLKQISEYPTPSTQYARVLRKYILALVEALEKAQTKADVYDMLRDDYGLREKGVGLADLVDWQAKRIAELESRTVTVKPMRPGHITVGGEKLGIYMRDEVDEFLAALTAAGIKVEAE